MGWVSTTSYRLSGTITSGLLLDSSNPGAGSPIAGHVTWGDDNWGDSNYEYTAHWEGAYSSDYGNTRVAWNITADAGDIKYQWSGSGDGITYDAWSMEADAVATNNVLIRYPYFRMRFIYYSPLFSDADTVYAAVRSPAFTPLFKNTIIDADDINSNFYYLGGDREPYGGLYLLPTTSIYDLGSDTYRWTGIYANSITLYGSAGSVYYRTYEDTFDPAGTTATLNITGLNGDAQDVIQIRAIGAGTEFYLTFNGDTLNSYAYCRQSHNFTTAPTYSYTYTGTASTILAGGNINIFSKTGKYRMVISDGVGGENRTYSGIWKNSTDTITSIQIIPVTWKNTNTTIEVFVRK